MQTFDAALTAALEAIRAQGLYRQLRRVDSPQSTRIVVGGEALLSFASNDYLGLASSPELKEASMRAIETYGSGSGASRLICGSLSPHHELEESLAQFKGLDAALAFSSGYAAALGAMTALAGKEDVVIIDRLVHACIVDAARLSGAKLRVYAHNDLDELEDILRWADRRRDLPPPAGGPSPPPRRRRVLVVTESVFSMDGDLASLPEIVELKTRYGAWLMVDEAHATGLYGPCRRGLAAAAGVAEQVEVQMGTLGKALGASGGYICGSSVLRDYLVNSARSFIFSTAPVPAAAAAAAAGIRVVQSEEGRTRCERLWRRVEELRPAQPSPILPVIVGDEAKAVRAAAALREQGLFVPAIRYPTVARGRARLRISLTAGHTAEDVVRLRQALVKAGLNPSLQTPDPGVRL